MQKLHDMIDMVKSARLYYIFYHDIHSNLSVIYICGQKYSLSRQRALLYIFLSFPVCCNLFSIVSYWMCLSDPKRNKEYQITQRVIHDIYHLSSNKSFLKVLRERKSEQWKGRKPWTQKKICLVVNFQKQNRLH